METPEGLLEQIRLQWNDPEETERIISLIITNRYLTKKFAMEMIKANPICYQIGIDVPQWTNLVEKDYDLSLLAVQLDVDNLGFIPDGFRNDEEFAIKALSKHEAVLNVELPQWKNDPHLAKLVIDLNPKLIRQINPTLYAVGSVDILFPTWKTTMEQVFHVLSINPALLNEVDPSLYNKELMEYIMSNKIPLRVMNKGTPEQDRFKQRIRDAVNLKMTQKMPQNFGLGITRRGIGMRGVRGINSMLGGKRKSRRR